MAWFHDVLDACDERIQYGEGHHPCTLCQRPRVLTDLARIYVDDEFFRACHGADDVSPTCYEKYMAGRKYWNAKAKERRRA